MINVGARTRGTCSGDSDFGSALTNAGGVAREVGLAGSGDSDFGSTLTLTAVGWGAREVEFTSPSESGSDFTSGSVPDVELNFFLGDRLPLPRGIDFIRSGELDFGSTLGIVSGVGREFVL